MRKKLINRFFLLVVYLALNSPFNATADHLTELNAKFHYGLLSDDYGILNSKDLAINACGVRPELLSFKSGPTAYQYWRCFESKNISFNCDSNGEPDIYEGVMGLIVIKELKNHVLHKYLEHRMWPIKQCMGFINDAAALVKGTSYACLSGSFISNETDELGLQFTSWSIERINRKKDAASPPANWANI